MIRISTLLLLCALPAFGANFTVSNTNDSGFGSLRQAILNANSGSGGTLVFASGLTGTIALLTPLPAITQNLAISGPGASSLGISGNNSVSVLFIAAGSTVSISGLTIADGFGDGVLNQGTLTLTNCTLSNNLGGGIVNSGTLTLSSSTLSGNTTGGDGGGIYNSGTASVTNSTLAANTAGDRGGGIFNESTLTLTNVTLSGNSGGNLANIDGQSTLQGTLLAGGSPNCIADPSVTSLGYNLSDDASCAAGLNQTGDVNSTAALLDPAGLQNNGGPTQTIALQPASPAVDAIPPGSCAVSTDQRGIARPQGAGCDIGAFELASAGPTVPALSPPALAAFALLLAALGAMAARRRTVG